MVAVRNDCRKHRQIKTMLQAANIIGLTLIAVVAGSRQVTATNNIRRYDPVHFERITRPEANYSSHVEPAESVRVEVGLTLLRFGPVDPKRSDFGATVQVELSWRDERLALNRTSDARLAIGPWHLTRIWKPELHFIHADPFTVGDILDAGLAGPVTGSIDGRGNVSVMKRVRLSLQCDFDLRFYPMDTQRCSIAIESSRLSTAGMQLEWRRGAIHLADDRFEWANFALHKMQNETGRINYHDHGPYPRLAVRFWLRRQVAQHLLAIYLPSTLFTVASWSGFWIHITGAPARVALVLTTMLTHVTSTKSVRDPMPTGAPTTALDVWILMCTMFIFAAIIEYAMANYFYYKPTRIQDKQPQSPPAPATAQGTRPPSPAEKSVGVGQYWRRAWRSVIPPFDVDQDQNQSHARRLSLQMDRWSRYVFPLAFVTFNLIYWAILAARSEPL